MALPSIIYPSVGVPNGSTSVASRRKSAAEPIGRLKNYIARLLFAALLGLSSPAFALPFINDGFELGNLTGWTAQGDVAVVSSYTSALGNVYSQFGGAFFARLDDGFAVDGLGQRTNVGAPTSGFPFPNPAPAGSILSTLPGLIPVGSNGAILSRPLQLNPGEPLMFSWAFLSFEGEANTFNDFALFAVDSGSNGSIDETFWLMDSLTLDTNLASTFGDTGWQPFSWATPGGFDGTAYWVVSNGDMSTSDPSSADDSFQSVLLIDTVPEPSSFLLFGFGLVGFVWWFSSRNDSQQRAPLSPC